MISVDGFSGFVQELHDRTEEEKLWEFFLHKVRDKSFEEFKGALNNQPKDSLHVNRKMKALQSKINFSKYAKKMFLQRNTAD